LSPRVIADAGEGLPEPLGVSLAGDGVNVAVYSAHAQAIEFCLFDAAGQTEVARIGLRGRTGPVFHGQIAGVEIGDRYGLRAHGAFAPAEGQRFNPNKLLVDPYALALDRPFDLQPCLFGYRLDDAEGGDSFDECDSAAAVPKAIVTAPSDAAAPTGAALPWRRTVVYELHVRGFTMTHPSVPDSMRGTFAALALPAVISHLKSLGVTTVELMPAAAWVDERHLRPLGLSNYWGYNPITFLAPDPRLAPGGWAEIRAASDALAAAGIECVLDVVFNHTGEGDALAPTLSMRGLDNATYYRLRSDNPARYVDDTGTGNTLALDRPPVLRLVMEALRAWRRRGGMAGFRFDLATTLGRRQDGFDPAAPLLAAIDQDPELRALKLIAEPWDIGPGGYQLGRFAPAWGEWNDRFRDSVRGFWRGDAVSLGELARRLSGSEDLLGAKRPSRSLNFVVAHDGFTLADLVSFETKHNEANGEQNRDGSNDNRSWNCGVEGPTDDVEILRRRRSDQRALLATLMLARGTPMLAMGAELGHSQEGDNNAYSQDNSLSWLNWASADERLLAFARRLGVVRHGHPALNADRFLTGRPRGVPGYPDIVWRKADGSALAPADWDAPSGQTLVMAPAEPDDAGLDRVVVVLHRGEGAIEVALPEPRDGFAWSVLADSADDAREGEITGLVAPVAARSVLSLAETPSSRARPAAGVDSELLGRLAQAAGVAATWRDLEGERHTASPDTLRALLAAMRAPAETTHQAMESLHGMAETGDRRALPHALVRRLGEAIEVPLRFDPGGPSPNTWLVIERADGWRQRLRASPRSGTEGGLLCRDGRSFGRLTLTLPPLEPGRYRLTREDDPKTTCDLTVAPAACFAPDSLKDGRRLFGLSAQLYALRRPGDQGIGDFTTLAELSDAAARAGAATVAINPLHALFSDQRERASPYFPSDRRFLDPIYLDLDRLAGAAAPPDRIALRDLPSIDHPGVWALKAGVLEAGFGASAEPAGLDEFIRAEGEPLFAFAVFQAISEARPGEPWTRWPADLRDAGGAGVRAFAEAHRDRVRFHQHLQWLCHRQLADAAGRAGELSLGLCRDLAVGAAPDGAEAWASARLLAAGVSIGAPPDQFTADGQVWGLPPFDPHRLEADGYAHFADVLARNMRHAGALRIDHVMGLARQFWVPDGARGADGTYVAYPFGDLRGQLALESDRARCLVIGEDLGTAPDGFREVMSRESVLSYRVAPFEKDAEAFRPPEAYPRLALACVATHDLPPFEGWWEGVDIAERLALELISSDAAARAQLQRQEEKAALIRALTRAGLIEPGLDSASASAASVIAPLHGFIGSTPSFLAVAQLEDLAAERTAVNLPGTDQERPNWRRRLAIQLPEVMQTTTAAAILSAIRATGRSSTQFDND
jgi:glycogen debranching enzyme GlgX/4-alpha-glucanotransferase